MLVGIQSSEAVKATLKTWNFSEALLFEVNYMITFSLLLIFLFCSHSSTAVISLFIKTSHINSCNNPRKLNACSSLNIPVWLSNNSNDRKQEGIQRNQMGIRLRAQRLPKGVRVVIILAHWSVLMHSKGRHYKNIYRKQVSLSIFWSLLL